MVHKGWHSRNYLPHFDSQDVVQFVTFRLADSLPEAALSRLRDADRAESLRHEMLDRGWGACWLRLEPIARLVENAFLNFDDSRYRLHAWTIMPNHVHVLFTVFPEHPLGMIVSSWKRFTARKANEQLERSGAFWQTDYWDRFIRNEAHYDAIEDYIDNNPVRARLVTILASGHTAVPGSSHDAPLEWRAPSDVQPPTASSAGRVPLEARYSSGAS